MSQLKVSKKQL